MDLPDQPALPARLVPPLIAALTILLVWVAAAVSLPGVPDPVPGPPRAFANSLIGQRWDFFTGDASRNVLRAFVRRDSEWAPIDVGSSSSLHSSGGFSRRPRTAYDEIRLLDDAATRAGGRYRTCDGPLDSCAGPAIPLQAALASPIVCGDVLLAHAPTRKPGAHSPIPPVAVLHVEVAC